MDNIWMWISFALGIVCLLLWRRVRWLRIDMGRIERSKAGLNNELTRMEYLQLSQQIQPHFLFNAFNLLLSLARLDRKEELLGALENLALFLRSGYTSRSSLMSIESELNLAAHYLAIQQMRFGSRLTVETVVSKGVRKRDMIPYLLQTFIENAFKHGLERQTGPVKLTIIFKETEGGTQLIVQDNGPQTESELSGRGGAGLHNLRRRLNLLYGAKAGIELCHEGENTLAVAWWPLEVSGD